MPRYDQAFFEHLYAQNIDPWNFRGSDYEDQKYRATINALPAPRYRKCLELGCSTGILTRMLSRRCDAVVAVDTSSAALTEARKSCEGAPVEFIHAHLPDGALGMGYDLLVVSEVLYYLSPSSIADLARKMVTVVDEGSLCIGVHWTGPTDYPLSGDVASTLFALHAQLIPLHQRVKATYRLDVWQFPPHIALSSNITAQLKR